MIAINLGRGCGVDGIYRPVLRIDLANPASARWQGGIGQPGSLGQRKNGFYRIAPRSIRRKDISCVLSTQPAEGYYMEPGRGQFGDGGRGDNAFTYVTVTRPTEGEADMSTLGSCCGEGYRQGPEQFIEPSPEALAGQDVVIWYVPQQENDERPGLAYCWADFVWTDGIYVPTGHPCAAGPRFAPVFP